MSELNDGHRARLKARLASTPTGTMADYETLELLLCLVIPRRDVKDLAKTLIKECGSLGKVLSADPGFLSTIPGVGPAVCAAFRTIRETISLVGKEQVAKNDVINSWDKLITYLRSTMAYGDTEHLRILYLNNKNALIADELEDYGTISSIGIYPREIMKKVIFYHASGVILAHNHPSGSTQPSKADRQLTEVTAHSLNTIDVKLLDHIIITPSGHYSFKENKLI